MPIRRYALVMSVVTLLAVGACSASTSPKRSTSTTPSPRATTTGAPSATATPVAGHVVVVMMENHSYSDIIGSTHAPYLNSLARQGVSLTQMHAVTHPSEPNYLALFSGSTQGVTDDTCPHRISRPDLGSELLGAHLSFAGYSEDLPRAGSPVCAAGAYARRHVPWANFTDLPPSVNRPFSAFPTDYATLPTVAFVIPNLNHDMHDGTIAAADTWLRQRLSGYEHWATTHGSVLIVTWDEDDRSEQNRIPTVLVGAGIPAKQSAGPVNLYSLLRLIEDRYGLPRLGASATAPAIALP